MQVIMLSCIITFGILVLIYFLYIFLLLGIYFYRKNCCFYKIFYYLTCPLIAISTHIRIIQRLCHHFRTLFKKIFKKDEYWLYGNSTLKRVGRTCFIYFILVTLCFFLYNEFLSYGDGNAPKLFTNLQIFISIMIPFFIYGILSNNSLLDSPDKKIDDSLEIFCKSVILLKMGKRLIKKEYIHMNLIKSNIILMKYIKTELNTILQYVHENKYHQPKELYFIFDALQITLQQFNKCLSVKTQPSIFKNQFMEFEKYYTQLLLIFKYFQNKRWTKDYKKYFLYTYIDINKIRKKFFKIYFKVHKEILQTSKFLN